MSAETSHSVDARACIRCGACATAAPAHFQVGPGSARVVRQPQTPSERRSCDAAAALCPTEAITASGAGEPAPGPAPDRDDALLHPRLMEVAEGARWPLGQVPWTRFDPAQVNAALCTAVRQMAFSEQATFSATRRFMDAFGEDTDFSQWLSVWFYEESRHPLVLLRWLALAGEELPPDFVRRGRVSTPFMKSRIGTLVTNVLSELIAAEAYLALARTAPEPLLRALTLRIAADESRHAASFFVFALRAQQASETPALERLDALKVLHFWFDERGSVSHPVNETMERLRSSGETAGWAPATASSKRMLRIAELLTGLRFDTPADVFRHLRVETRQLHRSSAPGP